MQGFYQPGPFGGNLKQQHPVQQAPAINPIKEAQQRALIQEISTRPKSRQRQANQSLSNTAGMAMIRDHIRQKEIQKDIQKKQEKDARRQLVTGAAMSLGMPLAQSAGRRLFESGAQMASRALAPSISTAASTVPQVAQATPSAGMAANSAGFAGKGAATTAGMSGLASAGAAAAVLAGGYMTHQGLFEPSGNIGQNALMTGLGTAAFGNPLIGAAAGAIASWLGGSSKRKGDDHVSRDMTKDLMRERGLTDENDIYTRADGTTFDLGYDSGREGVRDIRTGDVDHMIWQLPFEKDEQGEYKITPEEMDRIADISPAAYIVSEKSKNVDKERDEVLRSYSVNMLYNAATHGVEDPEQIRQNIRGIYDGLGLTRGKTRQLLHYLHARGSLTKEQYNSALGDVDDVFEYETPSYLPGGA